MGLILAEFKDLPFPPSVNEAYLTLLNRRRVGSGKLKKFKHEMQVWAFRNRSAVEELRGKVDDQTRYRLELKFKMPYKRLVTLGGAAKSFDTSNRIKPMEDALFELLGIDDRHVWEVEATKEIYGNANGDSICDLYLFSLGPLLA